MAAISKKLRSVEGGRLMFWCPGCDEPHVVGVREGAGSGWTYNGNPDAPTFSPSIHIRSGHFVDGTKAEDCKLCQRAKKEGFDPLCSVCHSFVTDGRIQFLSDCTHALAGQTVDIPDFNDERF